MLDSIAVSVFVVIFVDFDNSESETSRLILILWVEWCESGLFWFFRNSRFSQNLGLGLVQDLPLVGQLLAGEINLAGSASTSFQEVGI